MLKLPALRSDNSGFGILMNYYKTSWITVTAYKHETIKPN